MNDFQKRLENLSPKRLMLLALELQSRLEEMERQRAEPIAIVGLGCRMPGAEAGPAAFWKLLKEGRDAIGVVPDERWDAEAYYDASIETPGRMCTKWGGFVKDVDRFDAAFFGIAGREANDMDPQHRILLEVCWEALEASGHSPRKLAGTSTGVYVGVCASDYQDMLMSRGEEAIDAYIASGTCPSIAAGRISYTLGLHGPSMAVDTACSSSLVAIHLACQSLRTRECGMALAGGVNVILSPNTTIALSKAHMMAPDGRCKAFDARADGFVRAEGCGMVVLKRLSDARADGDHILAVIRGSAVNQDGRSSGITAPNGTAQEALLRAALAQAGVRPEEIGYVEAHGTGTSLGDPIEAHALAAVLGPGRGADNALVVGSVKTNVGHLESTAGVTGLIKVVLALQNEHIPAHLHFEQMNPHIDWGGMPVEIPVAGRPWPRGERRRLAGVSSFGFSGTNAHVVLEEAPAVEARPRKIDRSHHLLALSARSEKALRELGARYAAELARDGVEAGDLCYTANAGRAHFEHRVAVVGTTGEEIGQRLEAALPGERVQAREGVRPVFLFPGQGAQYAGMGKELYDTQPVFRAAIEECSELLRGELEKPLEEVLWGSAQELLGQTAYTQPGLFAVEYGLAALWRSWGIEPGAVVGHSVGEYVAACVAGVYTLKEGMKLIARRARLMQGTGGRGGMSAVRASEGRVREALEGLEERVSVAALNGPENVVISGYERELEIAEERLRERGEQVQRLAVSHGFHSPQMAEMEAAFAEVVKETRFEGPRVRLISSVTGKAVGREEMKDVGYWQRQVREPVRYRAAMESVREQGGEVLLEVGPGTTLGVLGRENSGEAGRLWLASMRRGRGEWEQMLGSLGQLYVRGAEVNWAGYDKPYGRRRMALPTYPFERQRYWADLPQWRRSPRAPEAPADWYYEISWQAKDESAASRSGDVTHASRARRWLIVTEGSDLAAGLAQRIQQAGDKVASVSTPEDISAQLRHEPCDLILYLPSGTPGDDYGLYLAGALKTAQAAIGEDGGASLWMITGGSQPVIAGQPQLNLAGAPLWGMGRTFALEHPRCWGGLIDLDPEASVAQNVTDLLSAVEKRDGEDQVAFRGGKRYVARLVHRESPSGAPRALGGDRTYLITGGMGGLGLTVASWMADHGARHLALVGRSAPGAESAAVIDGLRSKGVRVEVYSADVSSMAQMETVLRAVRTTMPGLGGIVHAAGVLDDGLVSQQTWERMERVLAPKVTGAWNLHRLTESLRLDFFVLFSSMSSVVGSPGQASYGAANAFLDALAFARRASGLPALAVNWGGWAEAGMAARLLARGRRPADFQLMAPALALSALERVLATDSAQIGIAAVDWGAYESLHGRRPLISGLLTRTAAPEVSPTIEKPAQQALRAFLNAVPAERKTCLSRYLVEILAAILGIASDAIDPSEPVTNFGLDSLMALELRNRIDSDLQVSIPTVRF